MIMTEEVWNISIVLEQEVLFEGEKSLKRMTMVGTWANIYFDQYP